MENDGEGNRASRRGALFQEAFKLNTIVGMNDNPYTSPASNQGEPRITEGESSETAEPTGMTRLEIAGLACKILALWLFAQAAYLLSAFAVSLTVLVGAILSRQGVQWQDLLSFSVTGIMPLAMAVVGVFIWLRAEMLASRIVSDDPTPITSSNATYESMLAIAVTAVGVFTLAGLMRDATKYVVVVSRGELPFEKLWQRPDFLGLVVGFVFAIFLIFGARRVARLALRTKSAEVQGDLPPDE